jgi:MFS family permease
VSLRRNRGYVALFSATTISNLGDGVGTIAYPWLASAVTRNPILVAFVFVAQRLPWLLFTLPAGVITDRVDRRRTIVAMDALRAVLTLGVAIAVLGWQASLPGPDAVDEVVGTRTGLYLVVLLATLLLGMAEVLRDNSGQTIMPAIVAADDLEKANGRMWSAELLTNTFFGPPLGSLLLGVAFCLPFFFDAASFFVAAALVVMIPGTFRAERPADTSASGEGEDQPTTWTTELREGVRWLWAHPLLRPMAIILGLMNAAGQVSFATFVLFAQEVLDTSPFVFAILGFGGALGGVIGGMVAPAASRRLGSGTCLAAVLLTSALTAALIGLIASWPAVMLLFAIEILVGTLWNVITVSLRQTIIPSHLLGRVNSVYRFFAWGMMPIGAALGGVVVYVTAEVADRDLALRMVWFVNAAIHLALFVVGRSKLTTAKIEAARAAGTRMVPVTTADEPVW